MKKISIKPSLLIILCLYYFSYNTLCAQESSKKKSLPKQANQFMQKAKKDRYFVGASAGIYAKGKIQWIGAVGDQHKGKQPASKDMLTRIASITKPMTAIAIMQLYERGKIDLDVPIQTYFPEFPKKEKGDITVRNLLQQTSGIAAYASDKEAFPTKHYMSLEAAIKVFSHRPLAFKPGTQYLYTTYGYVVLGAIIEKVSGLTYEEYLQENIWSVANMSNTSLEKKGQAYANKSKLYRKFWGRFIKSKYTDLSVKYPGGGVHSTAQDLLNFGKAIIDNKLIKKETLAMMFENPKIRKEGNGYGMGWYLYGSSTKYGEVVGHAGDQSGCASQLLFYPEQGVAVILLANTQGGTTFSIFITLAFELCGLGLKI